MVTVSYTIHEGKINKLHVTGHANHGTAGNDIVCAGVSAVVVGGLANLSSEENYEILVREGEVSILALKTVDEHDEIVLETIIVQLEKIEESYKKFIQIKKEVR